VDELHQHFGLSDPIGKAANMLNNLHMKPGDKISTYNVDFIYYVSQIRYSLVVILELNGVSEVQYKGVMMIDDGKYQ